MGAAPFVIAAGGTGGHILPAIRIGRELSGGVSAEFRVRYICGSREIESRIYSAEGIEPLKLSIGGKGSRYLHTVRDFLRCLREFVTSRPVAVLGMGGAACFPALAAATILRIPIFLHESNMVPGRVVRMFRRRAERVFLGLGGVEGTNVEVVGTPSKPPTNSNLDRDVILCVGGSQGAEKLNRLFLEAAKAAREKFPRKRFVLITGPGRAVTDPGDVEVREYEPDMPALLSRTHAIVSRSGAGSLADIANNGIPSILIPYPHAMDNHQFANACVFTQRGAALCMEEKDLTADSLAAGMFRLIGDGSLRERMIEKLEDLSTHDSASRIVGSMLSHLESRRHSFRNHSTKAASQ